MAHLISKLSVTFNRVDNQTLVIVNGRLAQDVALHGDPPLNDTRDLTSFLQPGKNAIVVICINWGGPCHFEGTIQGKDPQGADVVIGTWNFGPAPAGEGTVRTFGFEVIK